MSMRSAAAMRTLCEVLREIADMHQDTTSLHDAQVRHKLKECESMSKRMGTALLKYNKRFDKEWWEQNPNYEKNLKKRMAITYVT